MLFTKLVAVVEAAKSDVPSAILLDTNVSSAKNRIYITHPADEVRAKETRRVIPYSLRDDLVNKSGVWQAIAQRFHDDTGRWEIPHSAALLLPLPSLMVSDSPIGQLAHLSLFSDWAKSVGFSDVFLLPIYDRGRHADHKLRSPYSSFSQEAISPELPRLKDIPVIRASEEAMNILEKLEVLNNSQTVEYEKIREINIEAIWVAYENLLKQSEGELAELNRDFHAFVDQNRYWIEEYAMGAAVNDHFWSLHVSDELKTAFIRSDEGKKMYQVYLFTQWIEDSQYKAGLMASERLGIHYIDDRPVLPPELMRVSNPHYFNQDLALGVPGQKWGVGPFKLDAMLGDSTLYLRAFKVMKERGIYGVRLDSLWNLLNPYYMHKDQGPERGWFHFKDGQADPGHIDWVTQRILGSVISTGLKVSAENLNWAPYKEVMNNAMYRLGIEGMPAYEHNHFWDEDGRPKVSPDRQNPMDILFLSNHDLRPVAVSAGKQGDNDDGYFGFLKWELSGNARQVALPIWDLLALRGDYRQSAHDLRYNNPDWSEDPSNWVRRYSFADLVSLSDTIRRLLIESGRADFSRP